MRLGFHPARYYLLAWSVFLLGVILFVSRGFGILPASFITEYTLTIGAAVGAILLSFALADRIRILQLELKELTENLEHKVVERTQKLKNAQEELIEKAHKAGMADIATDILHNIGNILNSVAVSSQAMKSITRKSRIEGLKKANEMLKRNIEDLEDFIANNPNIKNPCTITWWWKGRLKKSIMH